ncbi:MAG: hypothetical protein HY331_17565 [Chloroflexi bacterium]|nr:hypothetical protein [Chloroflexota bacterium]
MEVLAVAPAATAAHPEAEEATPGSPLAPMSELHRFVGTAAVTYLLFLAVWGLGAYALRRELGSSFRAGLAIAEGLLVLQVIVGVVLLVQGFVPRDLLHLAYGTFAALGIPIATSYLSGSHGRRRTLIYALAMLFTFGLSVRAYMTGA